MSDQRCDGCGAPLRDGIAKCSYCDLHVKGRMSGVECPGCGELATADRRDCVACGASFTKGCLFCGEAAFLSAIACPRCHEAFAGAAERKKQREEQAEQQRAMGLAAQGLAVLGQVAGTPSGRDLLGQIVDAVIRSNDGND